MQTSIAVIIANTNHNSNLKEDTSIRGTFVKAVILGLRTLQNWAVGVQAVQVTGRRILMMNCGASSQR